MRDDVGKLRQEVSEVKEDTQALRQSMQEVDAKVGIVSDKMTGIRSRLDDVHAVMQQLAENLRISGPGGAGARQASFSAADLITAADAREFWTNYFPRDDEVAWAHFASALQDAFPDLAVPAALGLIKQRVDCDGDGKIHARELNIFSRRLGLHDSLRAGGRYTISYV
jgi:hypothetical protein